MKKIIYFLFTVVALIAPFMGFFMGMALKKLTSTNWGAYCCVCVFTILGIFISISVLMMKEILKGEIY